MNPGDEIAGRYRLEELRGRGAMSEVWRAHDDTLDRTVALKLLAKTADGARFRREAQAVAALAHENVMRVFDYGEDAAGPYMALEYLNGGTLEERLAGGALPTHEVEHVAQGMAAGLAHLHSRGIVHRDLKPANVLFDEEGRPKLADFGLARGASGAGTLTEAGTVLGTAAYISPEQAAGKPAVPASDVYSFGVILFRMLTGALPFFSEDALELIQMHRSAEPPPVEALNPAAPPALAALTADALSKDPAARPADGGELLARLDSGIPAIEATQIMAPVEPPVPPPPGRSRRAGALASLLLVLAVCGAVLAWAVTRPAAAPTRSTTSNVLATRKTRSHATTPTTTASYTTTTHQQTQTRRTHTHPATTTAVTATVPSVSVPTTIPTTTTPPATTTQPATTTATTTTSATTTTAAPPPATTTTTG